MLNVWDLGLPHFNGNAPFPGKGLYRKTGHLPDFSVLFVSK